MIATIGALVGGVALLAVAADQFVIGAARLALIRRVPALVVGVVVVGFGTSSPELLVSAIAAGGDDPEIAVGNVVGSNIANLTLLLGIGALILPIGVDSKTVRREAPLTVAGVATFAIAVQGGIGAVEGTVLLSAMAGALWWVVRGSNPSDPLGPETVELAEPTTHALSTELLRTVVGLIGTVGGAQALLWGATDVAERAGLAEGFVGATLVAVGTSLPELVTVVQSARRRETDLIVGNLLGSNLFNALAVGGVIGIIGVPRIDDSSLTIVGATTGIVVASAAWIAMTTGARVGRLEGLGLVVAYAAMIPLLS